MGTNEMNNKLTLPIIIVCTLLLMLAILFSGALCDKVVIVNGSSRSVMDQPIQSNTPPAESEAKPKDTPKPKRQRLFEPPF